uniref:50S ribosomal protein L35 n=1 Tax=Anotrichium furcellatum TaxID=41999 RepID=A0A4D6WNH5_9FLOR|nr:ribosomal protein L35 [Anotrichium furcellatum]
MYKLKTSKAIYKRFKITSSGKLLKHKACRSHLLEKKCSIRKHRLRKSTQVSSSDQQNFCRALPYIN